MKIDKDLNNINVGKIGENAALKYLIKKEYRIIERNHKEKWDEIDIIAITNDKILVFCEVKTIIKREELPEFNLLPEDNMTSGKFRKISRACRIFAGKHPGLIDEEKGWRIDLVAVDLTINGEAKAIRHYENIT
jgi:putative endonuclease